MLKLNELISQNALFVINHSGGKDSQAMFHTVKELVPKANMVIIHAHLPEVDWDGIEDHIRNTSEGCRQFTVQARKTFFEMVESRGMFPSPKYRQCTSDLKRGPIEKQIRHLCKTEGWRLVVNCMGLRAEESHSRAKQQVWSYVERNSKAGRQWYNWLPIHHLQEADVFDTIARHGQKPHWAYGLGMTRLSCVMCIMASHTDLRTAARLKPELAQRYIDLERRFGYTMMMPGKDGNQRYLEEIISA